MCDFMLYVEMFVLLHIALDCVRMCVCVRHLNVQFSLAHTNCACWKMAQKKDRVVRK